MKREEIKFNIQEAGCLLYVADKNLGGVDWSEMHAADWKDLSWQNAIMLMDLYQDDGYTIRVVRGELTDQEKDNWTSKVSWKLNLESGEMVVSGVCDEDLGEYLEDFGDGETVTDCHLGCIVKVPKGEYLVEVYSFPPNDLAGGWMAIEDRSSYRACFGKDSPIPFEKPLDYFNRTRPNETAPDWIKDGYEDAWFLDFVIHLLSLPDELPAQDLQNDGCLKWNYRKPEICPLGIRWEQED
jgi:hypothetical protein